MSAIKNPHQNESPYAGVNRCRKAQDADLNLSELDRRSLDVHRNWFEIQDKLLAKFPFLTEDDVCFEPGKRDEMMRALENKLGVSPRKLQQIIAYL